MLKHSLSLVSLNAQELSSLACWFRLYKQSSVCTNKAHGVAVQRNDFSTMHAPMNTYYIYRICMRLRWHVDVSRRAVPARVGIHLAAAEGKPVAGRTW